MKFKFKFRQQNQLIIFLLTLLIISVYGSSVLAAAPVVMENHFQIKKIEEVEIRAEAKKYGPSSANFLGSK